MEKKYVFIFGATGGIGKGFATVLQEEGCSPVLQYRTEDKKKKIESEFPNVIWIQSALDNKEQLIQALIPLREKNIIPALAALAAGMPGRDDAVIKEQGLSQEAFEAQAIDAYRKANVVNKKICTEALAEVYKDVKVKIPLLVVASQAGQWPLEQARKFGQVGYSTSMREAGEYGEYARNHFPLFDVHVLYTKNVETEGLQILRLQVKEADGGDVAVGQTPEEYARIVLKEIGFI